MMGKKLIAILGITGTQVCWEIVIPRSRNRRVANIADRAVPLPTDS